MMTVTEKQECRICGSKFPNRVLLDLGEQEIVDFIEDGEPGRGKAPLQLIRCRECGLVQLRHTVDADTLFKKFWYRSRVNEQMRAALTDVVTSATRRVNLEPGDSVLDIGSNDGELLLNYPENVNKVGFEPAKELVLEASARFRARRDEHWDINPNYFNAEYAESLSERPYKVITAIAMFYDLDDPTKFLQDVKDVLAKDGIFIVQMNYLGLMIQKMAFDNIGHEHLCYYSLTVLLRLFESVGLGIIDAELNDVNGGSIRVYAVHKEMASLLEENSVREILLSESIHLTEGAIKRFAERVDVTARVLMNFLRELRIAGKKVYAYGASTRGMTLLQTIFKEENAADYIIAAAERDEKKYGKKMAGLGIPIIPEQEAREKADYLLVLPYHFWNSIRQRERDWMMCGGRFILPLPYPKVVRHECVGLVSHDLMEELEKVKA